MQTSSATRTGGPLGVCAAIGDDFGFNPDLLRIALAAGLLWNLPAIVGAYVFLALLMLAGRSLFPVAARTTKASAHGRRTVDDFGAVRHPEPLGMERIAA